MYFQQDEKRAQLEHAINEAICKNSNPDDASLVGTALGNVLARQQWNDPAVFSNMLPRVMDAYTAAIVGPLAPRLLAIHEHLVRVGSTPDQPYDFESCSRYGVAFAQGQWKSMALQCQNFTYLIVLEPVSFEGCASGYAIHIRMCTASRYSYDFARPEFSELGFLGVQDKVCPFGTLPAASDYFKYKDGRDQGYLCSVKPCRSGEGYRNEHSTWGASFEYLGGILQDLARRYGHVMSQST